MDRKIVGVKLNFIASESDRRMLRKLVRDTDASSEAEVIRQGIRIYHYLVKHKGEIVAVSFEDGILVVQKTAKSEV